MDRSRTRLALGVVAGALLLSVTGCSDGTEPAATPSPAAPSTVVVTPEPMPPGVRLSFIQQRIDEGGRRAQVRVLNGDDRPLRVRSVDLDWAGYPRRPYALDSVVAPRSVLDLRYVMPPAVCSVGAGGPAMAAVITTASGRRIRRRLEPDGVRFLTRLWETECHRRRLDRAVGVRLGGFDEVSGDDGLELHAALELERRAGTEAVTITQVQGSVLFDLALGDRRTLPAGAGRASLPLVVRDGGRCDPHSRGDSTQTFLFRVWVSLGRGPALARVLEPTEAQQVRMLAFLDRACAG